MYLPDLDPDKADMADSDRIYASVDGIQHNYNVLSCAFEVGQLLDARQWYLQASS